MSARSRRKHALWRAAHPLDTDLLVVAARMIDRARFIKHSPPVRFRRARGQWRRLLANANRLITKDEAIHA